MRVDGTIIESYASMKSFRPKKESQDAAGGDSNSFKSRNPEADFHGEKRGNQTHALILGSAARHGASATGR